MSGIRSNPYLHATYVLICIIIIITKFRILYTQISNRLQRIMNLTLYLLFCGRLFRQRPRTHYRDKGIGLANNITKIYTTFQSTRYNYKWRTWKPKPNLTTVYCFCCSRYPWLHSQRLFYSTAARKMKTIVPHMNNVNNIL